jgi:hypothetical protein
MNEGFGRFSRNLFLNNQNKNSCRYGVRISPASVSIFLPPCDLQIHLQRVFITQFAKKQLCLGLRNMGYYHGYKGYRFINKPVNAIPYSAFEELSAIYDFDAKFVSGL